MRKEIYVKNRMRILGNVGKHGQLKESNFRGNKIVNNIYILKPPISPLIPTKSNYLFLSIFFPKV